MKKLEGSTGAKTSLSSLGFYRKLRGALKLFEITDRYVEVTGHYAYYKCMPRTL